MASGAGAGWDPAAPAAAETTAPDEGDRRDWAGGLPAEVLGKVAEALRAAEPRGHGPTLMAVTCKGWKNTLKEDAVKAAGGPELWRDWGNRFGEGLPEEVLEKVAEKVVAGTEAAWAAWLKKFALPIVSSVSPRKIGDEEAWVESVMKRRKREGNCLYVFARVCTEWRKAQLKVGGPLRSRVPSDVILPGQVGLVKWALAEGCSRELNPHYSLATAAAGHGHLELVQWLCGEQGFQMDPLVMGCAAMGGNLELVQWLRGEGCTWDTRACVLAARGGRLEVLRWLRDNDCPWDGVKCSWFAACGGHLETLRWARENGCPWDAATRDKAEAELGYTDDLGNLWGGQPAGGP